MSEWRFEEISDKEWNRFEAKSGKFFSQSLKNR
jgi:hypothetical protein